MERVEGVELGEVLPEGIIGQLVWRILNEVHYLSGVNTAQSSDAVVKLGEAASKISDSQLSFRLSKSYVYIVSPEFWKFEGYSMHTVSI